MQPLKKDLGSYMPAFFYMNVGFSYPPGIMTLFNLKRQDQATFVHEYIHYLQDISTFFGLNNAYVYSEYIHAASQVIYTTQNNEIRLPVEVKGNYGNVELNREVNKISTGDYAEIPNMFLVDIKEDVVKTKYNHPYFKTFMQFSLVLPKDVKVNFGGRAIMESMAYLIERNVESHCKGAYDYPYHAAEIVAHKIYPEFAEDDFRLIALCDMSLNSSNPGKTFVQTLRMFKERNMMPSPEAIYDSFYDAPCILMGEHTNFLHGFIPFAMSVAERLVLYLNDPHFSSFHNTVRKMIGSGIDYRMNHRSFMVDIARGGDLLHNESLRRILTRFGSPIIYDNQGNHCQIPSQYFDDSQFYNFVAVEQVYKTLSDCQDCCELYDWCDYEDENGMKRVEIDERCFNEPWSRAHDDSLCPYALLWRHWNYCKRKVINLKAIKTIVTI